MALSAIKGLFSSDPSSVVSPEGEGQEKVDHKGNFNQKLETLLSQRAESGGGQLDEHAQAVLAQEEQQLSQGLDTHAQGVMAREEAQRAPQPGVDFGFIEEQEGFERSVYVPQQDGEVLGKSGATVASGFDLGQRDEADLRRLGLGRELTQKLAPYVGKTGTAAQEFVEANPLELSEDEARRINEKVKQREIGRIEEAYNESAELAFDELPAEWQTVISSVAFQYGDLASRAPKFWGHVTEGRWDAAVEELRNFGDDYAPRRNREADLVASVRP